VIEGLGTGDKGKGYMLNTETLVHKQNYNLFGFEQSKLAFKKNTYLITTLAMTRPYTDRVVEGV